MRSGTIIQVIENFKVHRSKSRRKEVECIIFLLIPLISLIISDGIVQNNQLINQTTTLSIIDL